MEVPFSLAVVKILGSFLDFTNSNKVLTPLKMVVGGCGDKEGRRPWKILLDCLRQNQEKINLIQRAKIDII